MVVLQHTESVHDRLVDIFGTFLASYDRSRLNMSHVDAIEHWIAMYTRENDPDATYPTVDDMSRYIFLGWWFCTNGISRT